LAESSFIAFIDENEGIIVHVTPEMLDIPLCGLAFSYLAVIQQQYYELATLHYAQRPGS
jgi:hypothetical protein